MNEYAKIKEIMNSELCQVHQTKYGKLKGVKIGNNIYFPSSDSGYIEIYSLKKDYYLSKVITMKTFIKKCEELKKGGEQ